MKTQFIKYASVLTIAASALLSNQLLAAESNLQIETRAVSYADLNLAIPADQDKLHSRIRSAARSVCDLDNNSRLTVREAQAGRSCYKNAMASAMSEIPTHATALAQAGS